LKDYKFGYEYFLEQNDSERRVMAEKEEKRKAIEQSQIKAQSKKSKAQKKLEKKQKAKQFHNSEETSKKKLTKNLKRWN